MKDPDERSWRYRRERIFVSYRVVVAGLFETLIFECNLEGSDVYGKVALAEGSARADTFLPERAECIQRTAKSCGWSRVKGGRGYG